MGSRADGGYALAGAVQSTRWWSTARKVVFEKPEFMKRTVTESVGSVSICWWAWRKAAWVFAKPNRLAVSRTDSGLRSHELRPQQSRMQ